MTQQAIHLTTGAALPLNTFDEPGVTGDQMHTPNAAFIIQEREINCTSWTDTVATHCVILHISFLYSGFTNRDKDTNIEFAMREVPFDPPACLHGL
jgi:hypothetical protein